jgi:hypothetical protein
MGLHPTWNHENAGRRRFNSEVPPLRGSRPFGHVVPGLPPWANTHVAPSGLGISAHRSGTKPERAIFRAETQRTAQIGFPDYSSFFFLVFYDLLCDSVSLWQVLPRAEEEAQTVPCRQSGKISRPRGDRLPTAYSPCAPEDKESRPEAQTHTRPTHGRRPLDAFRLVNTHRSDHPITRSPNHPMFSVPLCLCGRFSNSRSFLQ